MGPSLRNSIFANTPPEYLKFMKAQWGKVEEEFDIFLKMGFTPGELHIDIDDTEDPVTIHVVLKTMKK